MSYLFAIFYNLKALLLILAGAILIQCGIMRALLPVKAALITTVVFTIAALSLTAVGLFDLAAALPYACILLYICLCVWFWPHGPGKLSKLPALGLIGTGIIFAALSLYLANYDRILEDRLISLVQDNNFSGFSKAFSTAGEPFEPKVWTRLQLSPPTPERLGMMLLLKRSERENDLIPLTGKLLSYPPSPGRLELLKLTLEDGCQGLESLFDLETYQILLKQGDPDAAAAIEVCLGVDLPAVVAYGNNPLLERLLKSGVNPDISTTEATRTARQKEFFKSIPISDLDRYTAALQETWTALREACAADNSEAINILLRAGASREGLGKQCEGKLPLTADEYK